MTVYDFPATIKKEIDQRTQQRIYEERNRSNNEQYAIRAKIKKKPNDNAFKVWFGSIGFIVGFFECCVSDTFVVAFGTWFLCTIIGWAIGKGLSSIISKSYNDSVNAADCAAERVAEQSALTVGKIQNDAEKEYLEYKNQFEAVAQQMSVQLAESKLAIGVIEWMTRGFEKEIDAADRRAHIQIINVPFVFQVYSSKITCNLGTYDFEIMRCRNLESPLEQTALSRAIASAIQLKITMKYPKDASGTDIVTNINYEYGTDFVKTIVVYSAVNGNYQEVGDW